MKVSHYISTKLRWISFLAILCVVFGHSVDGNKLIMSIVAQWHVPWFFIVSGAMLSYSLERHSMMQVVKAKWKTLLLPYIMWCGVGFVLIGIACGETGSVNQWLGIATPFPKGNPHLWYLHCLIVFTFAAILCRYAFLKMGRMTNICVVIICGAFFLGANALGISALVGTPSSPFYFLIGVIAKTMLLSDIRKNNATEMRFAASALIAIVFRIIWLNVFFSGAIEQTLRAICIIGQITTVWFGYDIVAGLMLRNRERLYAPWFLNSVFFVYCSHGFILNFVTPFCGQGGGGVHCNHCRITVRGLAYATVYSNSLFFSHRR